MATDHRSYRLAGQGRTAVILVHGICGSPRQFSALAHRLNERGYDCHALLLPGHGGDGRAFARCGAQDWLAHVECAVAEARQQGQRVCLVGHSLGSLLILECATRQPVDGLVLINAPLRLRVSPRQLLMSLRILLGKPERDDDYMRAYREAYSVTIANPLQGLMAVRPFYLLWRQMNRTVRLLGRVHTPVLVAQSQKDESVHPTDVDRLRDGLPGNSFMLLRLPHSHHSYFTPEDEQALFDRIQSFLLSCVPYAETEEQPAPAAQR